MKVLIMNEKLIEGGAEIYSLKLKEIMEKDNEVYLMTFDNNFSENIKKLNNNKNLINIEVNNKLKFFNKNFFNILLYFKIRKQINKINPDKIILNNIFCSPITQIKALKGYEPYQVIHDYSVVCPKSTCLKHNLEICKGYKNEKCMKECLYHNSKIVMFLKLVLTKKMEKLRKKYIKKTISPSEKLNTYLKDYGYITSSINNPMEMEEASQINIENKNDIIYVGAINDNKGIFKFLEAFNKIESNMNLKIIGKPSSKEDEEKLNFLISKNDRISYLGFVPNNQAKQMIKESKFMVVPSLWMENYPTTVLEAMMMKTFVIGSNRGGIPEMLADNRGITFNILNAENIVEVLNKIYNLSEEEYNKIINNAYNYVKENNSFDKYYERLKKELNI